MGSLERAFLRQREGLGSGAEALPEDQEGLRVTGLLGAGKVRQVPLNWIDMALPYRTSLSGGS